MAADTDQSVGDLLKELSEETSQLVRKEFELATTELTEKGKAAGIGFGLVGAAGMFGFLALAALTAAIVFALDLALPAWAAALVVAGAYALVAAALALRGREKVQQAAPPAPEKAIDSVKEDVEWAKAQLKSKGR